MRQTLNHAALTVPALAWVLLCAGCATTGYQQAERSTASMKDTRDLITDARRQVGVVMSTLNTMASLTEGDLVTPFQEFSSNLGALQRTGQRLRSQVQTMRSRSEAFLSSWQQDASTLTSEEARAQSKQRQAEMAGKYQALVESMDATRAASEPLMQNLKDIESMLSRDLTWAGVASTKGLVSEANAQAREVQAKASVVIRDLDGLAADLAPASP